MDNGDAREVLMAHSRRIDVNHPGYGKCRCGWNPDDHDEEHATHILQALEAAGLAVMPPPEPPKRDACVSCGTVLAPVFDDDTATSQYDNALEITLSGGYSMFFDNIDGDHHVFLCHDCAHVACLNLPWLNKLILPEKSHAHTAEFWEFNNGHLGWDKPVAGGGGLSG